MNFKMKLMKIWFLLSLVLSIFTTNAYSATHGDVKNCGDAKHSFKAWFNPDPIVVYKDLAVTVSFVPVVDVTILNAEVSVEFDDIPIYKGLQSHSCQDLNLPVCPMKKGKPITQKLTIPFNFPLPDGHYVAKANVTNEKGKWVLCAAVDTKIEHSQRGRVGIIGY